MNPEQNPQDYDEVTRLRLRINQLEIQRDAFAAALRKEVRDAVAEVIREEIRRQVGGDVDRGAGLKSECDKWKSWAVAEHAEKIVLKAEVERLTKAATEVDAAWSVYENGLIETPEWVKRSQVRDAVSRLWNAAKEGKPQP